MDITYGSLTYVGGAWKLVLPPHLAIRAKRAFPKARLDGRTITLRATPETARDIQWFDSRWPLEVSADDRALLDRGAALHEDALQRAHAILNGSYEPSEAVREPAQESRPYQAVAGEVIATLKRVLIGDELGLGKTHEGALALRNADSLPAVFVVPTSLTTQWERQLNAIWPNLRTHIARKGAPYDMERYGGPPDILILNYAKLAGWQSHLVGVTRTIVFDEVHDLRKGVDSAKGRAARAIADQANYVVGLSATPIQNYGAEIWHVYNIIAPDFLGSWQEFLREWPGRQVGSVHGNIALDSMGALSQHLRDTGRLLARTRHEVGRQLPYGAPIKVPHQVDADAEVLDRLSGDAIELAKFILSQGTSAKQRFIASGNFDMRMRQETGIAKAPYVAGFVRALLESTQKVVVWAHHHAVFGILSEALAGYGVVTYTGRESTAQKDAAQREFVEGDARVLLMALRSGAGLDGLQQVCSTGVFAELDWSPKVHDQALGRLARDGQLGEVLGYYLTADRGSDPKISEILDLKHQQAEQLARPDADVLSSAVPDEGTRVQALARSLLEQHGITVG